jgi:hypothetical protein
MEKRPDQKTPILDVCVHVTTNMANNGISIKSNQEYVKIILAIISILLYL